MKRKLAVLAFFILCLPVFAGCRGISQPTAAPTAGVPPVIVKPAATETGLAVTPTRASIETATPWSITGALEKIPQYQKYEISFSIHTAAKNLQMPYDPAPPPGIQPGIGVTVDALFTPDNWHTVYRQPAFYYQGFQDEVLGGKEWIYPNGKDEWKVRFTPDQVGIWQYRIVTQDASGKNESAVKSFKVVPSENRGFLRVSARDPRYFEYEDGSYFPGLGYNMNYDHISWVNPVLDNEANFRVMGANGIQLVRIWLSEWSIFGDAWNPWNAMGAADQYIPYSALSFDQVFQGSDVSMVVDAQNSPCMFMGVWKAPPAVKRNARYRIRVRYKTDGLSGPQTAGSPHGFTVKLGGWMDAGTCNSPDAGERLTVYQPDNTAGWQILEGSWDAGENDFLPILYLTMDNTSQGRAFVDYVWVEEDMGGGMFGPNIISKPWMSHDLYMEQRNSFAFDRVVELAEKYNIALKPVIDEKNGWIFNHIDYKGLPIPDNPLCQDQEASNDPPECPGNQWFYGNWREMTKVRWLQQAWWRYLQARWGYSTSIHSWELLNEGDPYNGQHYTLADEFGKYMHQFKPNDHPVSTSFWHSFPRDEFWNKPEYSHVDFADYHEYITEGDMRYEDTALATDSVGMQYGATRPGGAGKPLVWGELGFVLAGSRLPSPDFQKDTGAVWLHNFLWSLLNPSGVIPLYWYEDQHIYFGKNEDGSYQVDHRDQFGTVFHFLEDIPLNNGSYQDAAPSIFLAPGFETGTLRVWGQKDLVHGRAHLWIQNTAHSWRNVVDGAAISPVSGTITLSGFQPGAGYLLEWWDTYQTNRSSAVMAQENIQAGSDGTLSIPISNLLTDVAVKIEQR